MDNKYFNNLKIPIELLGGYMCISPFSDHNSGSRDDMFSSHLSQFQLPEHGEFPNLFTGGEIIVKDYEYNSCELTDDIEVLSIIPKYNFFLEGKSVILNNPIYIIVFKNLSNNEIDYISLETYMKFTEGYGYENKFLNSHMLSLNSIIPKGTKLYTSKAHHGEEYRIGVNANVAFMTLTETIEDAFVISKSLAKKLSPSGIETISIQMNMQNLPLNLYGDDIDYKIIPNIGDTIRRDGVICAFKNIDDVSVINDLKQDKLITYNKLFDTCFYGKAGAEIIDIDVYLDPSIKLPSYFNQIKIYHDSIMTHYKNIYDVYKKYKDSFVISKKFNTLVTRAMSFLYLNGNSIDGIRSKRKKKITLADKDKPISIRVDITYKYKKEIVNGFKITGRDGGKGVICSIWDDKNMPTDENGFVADLVIDPASLIKRTTVGQAIEQGLNYNSMRIIKELDGILSVTEQFNYIIKYLKIVSPKFGDLVEKTYTQDHERKEYLDYIKENGLKIEILSAQKNINVELFEKLYAEYGFKKTNVSFISKQLDGTYKKIVVKDDICIGNKYIYVLYIAPEISASGIGYTTQFGSPSSKSTKFGRLSYPIKQSCVKFGEDEFRVLLSTLEPEVVIRLKTMLGTSLSGLEKLIETILKADLPSNISYIDISNKELIENDVILGIIHPIFQSLGINLKDSKATKKDYDFYHKAIFANERK